MTRHIAMSLLAAALSISSGALADKKCRSDEVEVYSDTHKRICVDAEEYHACIRAAGESLKSDLRDSCGGPLKSCLDTKKLELSISTAGCLAGSIAGCGKGKAACAAVCGVVFKGLDEVAYNSCVADTTPCYEAALARDKARKDKCKEGSD